MKTKTYTLFEVLSAFKDYKPLTSAEHTFSTMRIEKGEAFQKWTFMAMSPGYHITSTIGERVDVNGKHQWDTVSRTHWLKTIAVMRGANPGWTLLRLALFGGADDLIFPVPTDGWVAGS